MAEHPSSSLTGRQFGDYRILSPLGTGGMGAVYAAEDVRLHRKVAIKFLTAESLGDAEVRQRLFHEARAAAAIDHPNICTIYDVGEAGGQAFIVMQHVEGQTLAARLISGPMGTDQAVDVAAEVATALVEAHERGIVHRDVKPQNIMLASRGHVKVLDFGVARIAPTFDDETVTASGLKGLDGAVAGTIPYMSPEQIRNETLDGRSDVFSLGIVLHELLTGSRPFGGSGSPDTIAAILTKEPPPFGPLKGGPSPELERIVRKCLEKDRELRYQSARELLADLRRLRRDSNQAATIPPNAPARRGHTKRYLLAAAVLAGILAAGAAFFRWSSSPEVIGSVAILPLTSVNVAPALSYQTESITGGLIETLSRLPDLKVMSRNAVLRYQGKDIDAQTVGRELGVEAVVAGRLVGNGDVLTLDLELVDADDNSHVWGKRYEVTAANLLALQREIPAELSETLRPQAAAVTLVRRDTTDLEAHRLYSLGRQSLFKWTQDTSRMAVEYFQKAIDRDPTYALAYAGMAAAYTAGNGPGINPKDAHRLGRAAALKALELDPDLGEAHAALAGVLLDEDWDFAGAEREFRRAIQLNPNDEWAHHSYSHFLLTVGRHDEAFAESRKVDELNPVNTLATGHYAFYYLVTRQFDRAIEYYNRYFKVETADPGSILQFADALYQKGSMQEAFDAYLKGHAANGATEAELAALKDAIAKRGIQGYLQTRIAQLEKRRQPEQNVTPMTSLGGQLASLYARVGDKDRAFQQLERMYAEHDEACVSLLEESSFHPLHSDPRFGDLLRRIGLPAVSKDRDK
jgi:serine/threonine-protein kinase